MGRRHFPRFLAKCTANTGQKPRGPLTRCGSILRALWRQFRDSPGLTSPWFMRGVRVLRKLNSLSNNRFIGWLGDGNLSGSTVIFPRNLICFPSIQAIMVIMEWLSSYEGVYWETSVCDDLTLPNTRNLAPLCSYYSDYESIRKFALSKAFFEFKTVVIS